MYQINSRPEFRRLNCLFSSWVINYFFAALDPNQNSWFNCHSKAYTHVNMKVGWDLGPRADRLIDPSRLNLVHCWAITVISGEMCRRMTFRNAKLVFIDRKLKLSQSQDPITSIREGQYNRPSQETKNMTHGIFLLYETSTWCLPLSTREVLLKQARVFRCRN